MAIRKVARMGHPVLRTPARNLTNEEILSPDIQGLIEDLHETMEEYGGIGIAAPQVHESLSVAIIDFQEDHPRYGDQISGGASQIIINPKITVLDETLQGFWEGCLSVPDIRGFVQRPRKIQIDFLNEKAESCTVVAEDFLATVYQHELDHLFGVLFVDRIEVKPGESPIMFLEEYQRFQVEENPE